jgi:hypothetical protein
MCGIHCFFLTDKIQKPCFYFETIEIAQQNALFEVYEKKTREKKNVFIYKKNDDSAFLVRQQ